jgi:outer membrane protein assembly factor BamD (BamD/ComL family)
VPALPPAPRAAGDTSLTGTLRLAGAYIDAGQPERAIPLLEDLLAANPGSYPAYARLREAYVAARRFDEMVILAEQRIAAAGPSPTLLAERGAALFQAGRPDDAASAWNEAVGLEPDGEMTYRLVADAQGALGLYAEAAATLLLGRERLSDPTRFRAEMAHLHGLAGDAEKAGDEWFSLLEESPSAERLVRTRLTRLLAGEATGPLEGGSRLSLSPAHGLAAAAARAVRRAPLNRAVREADAWLAMQRGDWAAALDATIAIDRLEMEEGQRLVTFGETAASAGAMSEAERAFALAAERHPGSAAAPLARLGMAEVEALRSTEERERPGAPAPRARAAMDGLVAFAESQPGHPRGAGALRTAARLARDVLGDPVESERLLRAAAARPALTAGEAAAIRLDLARLALSAGSLAEARALFTAVEETERIGDAAEAARLELAYLDFYAGDTAGALARAEAMDANTGADVANDALLLRLLLTENVDADSSTVQLAAYARAALKLRQGRPADALIAVDSLLAAAARHPVADDADFLRALALRAAGRTAEALDALAEFPERHQESYLAERARFLAAEVHERDARDPAAARAAYEDFLTRHPRSLLAPEARTRLRRLSEPG